MNLNDVIQILMGGVGTIGFSLLFNVRGRKLFFGTLGGLLSWTAFLLLENWIPSEALRYFLSTAAITLYCEVLARVEKTPTTTASAWTVSMLCARISNCMSRPFVNL